MTCDGWRHSAQLSRFDDEGIGNKRGGSWGDAGCCGIFKVLGLVVWRLEMKTGVRAYRDVVVVVELHGDPPLVGKRVQRAAERDERAEKDDRLVLHAVRGDDALVVVLRHLEGDVRGVGVGEGVCSSHTLSAITGIGFKQTRLLLVLRVVVDGKHETPQVALFKSICT